MNEVGMKQSAVQNTDFNDELDSSLMEKNTATVVAEVASKGNASGAGAMLMQARQSKEWTVYQVAEQLKLSPRQVTALEMNQYELLPQMVIVRGFIRSYAKLLKIDAAEVLNLLPDSQESNPTVSVFKPVLSTPFLESRSSLMGRQDNNIKYLIGAAVLAVLALSFYVFQKLESEGVLKKWFSPAPVVQLENSEVKAMDSASQVAVQNLPGSASGVLVAQPNNLTGEPLSSASLTQAESASAAKNANPEDKATTSSQLLASPVNPSVQPDVKASDLKSQENLTNNVASNVTSAATSKTADNLAGKANEAKPAEAFKQDAAEGIKLKFRSDTWFQVKTSDGQLLTSHMAKAGTQEIFSLKQPLQIRIGNASGVEAWVRGAPLEMVPPKGTNVLNLSVK